MVQDLSFIHEKTPEEQENAVRQAVEYECIRAIATYLTEVADTMDANGIESLNVPSLRAMADSFNNRIENAQN
jgi:hypothetical protein